MGSEVESWRAPVLADGPSPPYFFQHADAGRVKVSEADLDDLLDETALRDMKLQFWRRYKTRFPPELYRSDATLSRVTRELNKRMLCVFSVWKVKSLQFQLVSASKKRKLGENLFTEDQESCLGTGSPTLIGCRSSLQHTLWQESRPLPAALPQTPRTQWVLIPLSSCRPRWTW